MLASYPFFFATLLPLLARLWPVTPLAVASRVLPWMLLLQMCLGT